MKKILLMLTAIFIVSYLLVTSACAQPVTVNYSVTFDFDDFKDCSEPQCKLLSRLWERCSDDIQNYFASLASSNSIVDETVENNSINVNITISHPSTLTSYFKKIGNYVYDFWASESGATEDSRIKLQDIHEKAENTAREILERITTSGELYCLDFVKDASYSELIFGNNDVSKLTFFDENTNFLDSESLLKSLKKICSDELVVRSNTRFMCAPTVDLSPENFETFLHDIAAKAVFNAEKLQNQSGDFDSSLHKKLTSWLEKNNNEITGTFRFFFNTSREGVYIVEALKYPEKESVLSIAGENAAVINCNLERELEKSLSLLYGDLDFWLTRESSFLDDPNITLDNCLKIFIDDIKDRLAASKITEADIEELKKRISDWRLLEFFEKGALEKIDSVAAIRNDDYFIEGNLAFCKAFTNSIANYAFINEDKFKEFLSSFNDGELSTRGQSSFSFKCSKTWRPDADFLLLSIKSLKPEYADETENLYEDSGITRLFFKTNIKNVYLVAILQNDKDAKFYIASRQSFFSKDRLNELLRDEKVINYEYERGRMTFNLWMPDSRLLNGDAEQCINIFVNQFLQRAENFETARW
ncbi:MAG: hypothetical protein IJ859_08585 [Synergistaceae bacterium]|nr:hypothetical protein [Synergistaceae bacterium]MBR2208843.1 hypothetical protein [Synergistaceae bacterium]